MLWEQVKLLKEAWDYITNVKKRFDWKKINTNSYIVFISGVRKSKPYCRV